MRALRHALVVTLCYGVACLAAPFFVIFFDQATALFGDSGGSLLTGFDDLQNFIFFGAYLTAVYAAAPFLCAIGLMRYWRQHGWLVHGVAGLAVSFVALAILSRGESTGLPDLTIVLAGFGCGLVYWACRCRFGWAWVRPAYAGDAPAPPSQ